MNGPVVLKSYKGVLKLILDPDLNFNELLKAVRDKFYASRNFLGSMSFVIDIEGRVLSDIEEELVIDAINASCDIVIGCIVGKDEEGADRVRKLAESASERLIDEDMCHILHGSVMDKKTIEVEDSIIVLGDVNPGSSIVSRGSIIVLGGLYGSAHAGAGDDESAFICAIELAAECLSIGDKVLIPDSKPKWSAVLKSAPKIVRLNEGEITISPLNRVVMEKIYESKKIQA